MQLGRAGGEKLFVLRTENWQFDLILRIFIKTSENSQILFEALSTRISEKILFLNITILNIFLKIWKVTPLTNWFHDSWIWMIVKIHSWTQNNVDRLEADWIKRMEWSIGFIRFNIKIFYKYYSQTPADDGQF